MKKLSFSFFLILFVISTNAQLLTSKSFGYKHFQLKDTLLGNINFYVTQNGLKKSKPLLLYLDGSGYKPLFSVIKKPNGNTQISSKLLFDDQNLSKKFHIVLISKAGVPFVDSLHVKNAKEFRKKYKVSKEYSKHSSFDWRVQTASKVINRLKEFLPIKNNQIIVMGDSEGGLIVPKLAEINKNVTKIVSIVGGGLNPLYDLISEQRLKAQKGIISHQKAQNKIDSIFKELKDIYAHPKSMKKTNFVWSGSYKKWASYGNNIPIESLLKLNIPILLIASGNDRNSPIVGIDYVKLEFIRHQKNNLTYKVYPNCDHWFFDKTNNTDKLNKMMQFTINWIEKKI